MDWISSHGHLIAFFGAVLAAVGVALTTTEQNRQQARYEKQVADLNATLAARTAELAAKSDEVARLAQQGLNATTGGDSFVYLEPLRKRGRISYFVRQSGANPTFDVVVRVEDGTGQFLFGPATSARSSAAAAWIGPDRSPHGRLRQISNCARRTGRLHIRCRGH